MGALEIIIQYDPRKVPATTLRFMKADLERYAEAFTPKPQVKTEVKV